MLTKEQIRELLTVRKETAAQDYKRALPQKGHKNCGFLDLLKDIVAMANSGGGTIVFGVENKTYTPVGLSAERTLDETDITIAVKNYIDAEIDFELCFHAWEGKDFGFLRVKGADSLLVFLKPAQCAHCGRNADSKHFHIGAIVRRVGSQTSIADAAWIKKRVSELPPRVDTSILHNLPGRYSIYDHFIGRTESISEVLVRLADQRRRITWIQGSGGIGKTALAYRVAERIVNERGILPEVAYVVWVSAKDDALTVQGVESRKPTLTSVADIVHAIANTTGLVRVTDEQLKGITTAKQALACTKDILEQQVGLLVVDNMETVEDKEVFAYLNQLPGSTRALATTRHSMDHIGTDSVTLEPMATSEAADLIKNEAVRCGNSWIDADENATVKIINLSGRIPLAVRLIVPLLTSRQVLTRYENSKNNSRLQLLDFCYHRTFQKLSTGERRMFLALALFDQGASLADTAFILDTSLDDRAQYEAAMKTLTQLWRFSLVFVSREGLGDCYQIQSLVREFAIGQLAKDPALKQEMQSRKRALEEMKTAKIEELPARAREIYQQGDINGALLVLDDCLRKDSGNLDAHLLRVEILLSDECDCIDDAEKAARHVINIAPAGSRHYLKAMKSLVDIEMKKGRYDKAIELLCGHRSHYDDVEAALLKSKCYLRLGRKQLKDRLKAKANYREAASAARQAVTRARNAARTNDAIRGFTYWAEAALEFDTAVAYQAAQAGLSLKPKYPEMLEGLRDKAASELDDPPERDLLRID